MGLSLSKLHNVSFQSLFSSEATMQAQHYARTKMDYLVFNGYNALASQGKTSIENTEFQDTVILGSVATDTNGISHRLVTVSVYKSNETSPRASLNQVFYSNDANKYVTNGSSATSSISMNYDKDNDKLYAEVDGVEKVLGSSSGVPVGTVIAWAGKNAPATNGIWLECNGQSCIAYPELVAVLGKSTVPDYRGRFLESATTAGTVGTVKEAGLPNITATMDNWQETDGIEPLSSADNIKCTGAFYISNISGVYPHLIWGDTAENAGVRAWGFDASRSNSIYGRSDTVQPASVIVRRFIKAA